MIYGSLSGLRAAGEPVLTQDSPGILDVAERGDHFGHALSTEWSASGTPGESRPDYWNGDF